MRYTIWLATFTIFSLNPSFGAEKVWPKPDFSSCNFYPKVEKVLNCEKRGSDYLTAYGEYYCHRFKESSKEWKGKLKNWVDNTGLCLQEMLYDNRAKRLDPCSNLEEFAFDSHPICYKQYGICSLSPSEYWQLKDLLRSVDILNVMKKYRQSKVQFDNVYAACEEKFQQAVEDTFFNMILKPAREAAEAVRGLTSDVLLKSPKQQPSRNSYFEAALSILLFGDAALPSKQAALAFDRQFNSKNTTSTREMEGDAVKCFASLKANHPEPGCDNKVLAVYGDVKVKQAINKFSPVLTEKKLRLMLRYSENIEE